MLNLWVRALWAGDDPRAGDDQPVTDYHGRGVSLFLWQQQQDSRHILYWQDQKGNEDYHLYQVETRRVTNLTPFPGVQGALVADAPERPDEILISLNKRDPRLFDVYRLDLTTGALALDKLNPGDVAEWAADNALVVRVARVQLADGGTELRVREGDGAPWRVLETVSADEAFDGVAGFSPDDRRVWLLSSAGANATRLMERDPGSGESRTLAEDGRFDVGAIVRHPATHALEAVRFVRERREWVVVDPSVEADFCKISWVCDGDWSLASRDVADMTWIVAHLRDDPGLLFCL